MRNAGEGIAMSLWTAAEAAAWLTPPLDTDDKYARGVLGLATGSSAYPGAAVLGAEAAMHTGVGMLRYLGPDAVGRLVLQRRPEIVLGSGRANAWVLGSGMAATVPDGDDTVEDPDDVDRIAEALRSGAPVILDAAAIGRAPESIGPVVITPHAGELAALLGVPREAVTADPVGHATRAAAAFGAVVLLKGATTVAARRSSRIEAEGEAVIEVHEATPWLATAGAGDALAGILGALVAARAAREGRVTPDDLLALGATAAFIHGRAARLAAHARELDGRGGGPFTVLELCAAVPEVVRGLLGTAS